MTAMLQENVYIYNVNLFEKNYTFLITDSCLNQRVESPTERTQAFKWLHLSDDTHCEPMFSSYKVVTKMYKKLSFNVL